MPVFIDRHYTYSPGASAKPFARRPQVSAPGGAHSCLRIGLVNNMSDEALKATERQFLALLDAASDGMLVHLSLYTLPGVTRSESIAHHLSKLYSGMEDLWESPLDGLIVTGREPFHTNLTDEPYWESFTRLLEWAQESTHSTVWSCLAAHAAVLHMDGIERVKRNEKLSGIFECARAMEHPLTARTPSRFNLPHSRWNGLPEDQLTRHGYDVLTRAAGAGVDTFIKRQTSLFVFFQGHPEYESDTLLREYRRDVGRYFKGEAATYPDMPLHYFDEHTVDALTALQERAAAGCSSELVAEIAAVMGESRIINSWHASATGTYRNWLKYISAKKENVLRPKRVSVAAALETVS